MPPKGATRKTHLDKSRPHFLNCNECKIKIKCPTFQNSYEDLPDQHSEISMQSVKDYIRSQTVEGKSEILAFILMSENDTIWEDQNISSCNISQSTLQTITGVNADEWYESRHPLMRTIADELSKGTNRRGHDIERALEREEKSLTKSLKCRLIGSCYKIVNHKFTSPVEAKSAILFRSIAQSKLGSIILSRQGPCGSKDAFEQIVIKNCSPEIDDGAGDVLETIDNNERGSRTYSAKLNSSMKMSLVTARNIYR